MHSADPMHQQDRPSDAKSLTREDYGGWPIFLIGLESQFVPDITMYRLKGERPDVWRQLARPPDEMAYRFFEDEIGHYLEEVMFRPDWVFTAPSRDGPNAFEPEVRFVDGLLCGCRVFDSWRREPLDLSRPQTIRQSACTEDAYFQTVYHRSAGDRFAYLVSQEPCPPPMGMTRYAQLTAKIVLTATCLRQRVGKP